MVSCFFKLNRVTVFCNVQCVEPFTGIAVVTFHIEVYSDNGYTEETLYDDKGDGENIPVFFEFPNKKLSSSENMLSIEVTDKRGRTQTFTNTVTPDNHQYKVETPHGEYSREWLVSTATHFKTPGSQ